MQDFKVGISSEHILGFQKNAVNFSFYIAIAQRSVTFEYGVEI